MISHGSIPSSRSGTRSRWTSTPAPSRAISASEEASPAAPQSWSDSTSPRSTSSSEASISFLPVNGSPTCTEGRFSADALAELLAREHGGAADPVAAGRRAVEDEHVAGPARARARDALGRQEADAHRVDEAVAGVRLVEDRLAADGGHADAVPVVADPGDRAPEAQSGAPKRSPSSSATGRAPIATMSRRIPPTPVAAPWNGSTRRRVVVRLDLERDRLALAEVDHARVLARPLEHALARRGQPLQQRRRVLVAAVLRPEQREDGELEVVRLALEQLADSPVLGVGETERAMERLFRDPRQRAESIRLTGRSRSRWSQREPAPNLAMLLGARAIWGASFMFIKVAVRELSPATLIVGRLGLAALTLGAARAVRRRHAARRCASCARAWAGSSSSRSSTRRSRSGSSRGARRGSTPGSRRSSRPPSRSSTP